MFAVNDIHIRQALQTSSSVFIINLEQFSHVIHVLHLLTLNRQFLIGLDDITKKASQNEIFFPCNFSIMKICVAIRLAEDGTRMGRIQFQLSSSFIFFVFVCCFFCYKLTLISLIELKKNLHFYKTLFLQDLTFYTISIENFF